MPDEIGRYVVKRFIESGIDIFAVIFPIPVVEERFGGNAVSFGCFIIDFVLGVQ